MSVPNKWKWGCLVLFLAGITSANRLPAEISADISFREGGREATAKSRRIRRIRIVQDGVRPRWSPGSDSIVFDRKTGDRYYHVFVMTRDGQNLRSLTEGKPGIPQKNSGNAVFHPSGRLIIFISEEPRHFLQFAAALGDPGVGLFSNLWATNLEGSQFWKLTDIPIKRGMRDPTPIYATVNPLFSPDGNRLLWTERYANGPTRWGRWRIKAANFALGGGTPSLTDERVLYQPQRGNYVTAMGFLPQGDLIMAGNLDGQHEFGMDLYRYNMSTGALKNLTNTPEYWEEDASVTPAGRIIYMSNAPSRYKFNFQNPNWQKQPVEREYYIMDADGGNKERLTYFNDSSAPEYLRKRIATVASDISPDGRELAATLGVDMGSGPQRENYRMEIALIELSNPL